jgi:hypothetical protein
MYIVIFVFRFFEDIFCPCCPLVFPISQFVFESLTNKQIRHMCDLGWVSLTFGFLQVQPGSPVFASETAPLFFISKYALILVNDHREIVDSNTPFGILRLPPLSNAPFSLDDLLHQGRSHFRVRQKGSGIFPPSSSFFSTTLYPTCVNSRESNEQNNGLWC